MQPCPGGPHDARGVGSHPDRAAQFGSINSAAQEALDIGDLVLSVDTKKKEVVGDVNTGGHDWQITGRPEAVLADRLWMHTALVLQRRVRRLGPGQPVHAAAEAVV